MKKKVCLLLGLIMIMCALTACGDEIPDLTEEQTEIITEYAAGLLLKYDSSSPSRLLASEDAYVKPALPEMDIPVADDEEEIGLTIPDEEPAVSFDDVTVTDIDGQTSVPQGSGWKSFTGSDGLDITYAGSYEIVDSYPGDNSNSYFTMDASKGNKLLVIHFTMTNVFSEDKTVNMNDYNLRYRVSINGEKNKQVLTTLLDNDILSYKGTIAAGESIELVAVAEAPESEFANINSMVMVIKGPEFSTQLPLE